jgi:hypothetical protein
MPSSDAAPLLPLACHPSGSVCGSVCVPPRPPRSLSPPAIRTRSRSPSSDATHLTTQRQHKIQNPSLAISKRTPITNITLSPLRQTVPVEVMPVEDENLYWSCCDHRRGFGFLPPPSRAIKAPTHDADVYQTCVCTPAVTLRQRNKHLASRGITAWRTLQHQTDTAPSKDHEKHPRKWQ